MRSTRMRWLAVLAGVVALAGWTAPARAAKVDEGLAKILGKTVVEAAHPTAKGIELLDSKEATPKAGRRMLTLRMKYYGKVTSTKYTATIRITIDTNKTPPRVLDIDYKDDNKVPYSKKGVKDAEGRVTRKLPKKL